MYSSSFITPHYVNSTITRNNSRHGVLTEFGKDFGKPDWRKQQARDQLCRRFQAPKKRSTSCIEDVICFSRRVDDTMFEEEKIRPLFKGLSHSLFSSIASAPPTRVEAFLADWKRFEDFHRGQIFSTSFDRLPEVLPSPSNNWVVAPSVRGAIRSELQTFLASLMPQLTGTKGKVARNVSGTREGKCFKIIFLSALEKYGSCDMGF